MIFPFLLRAARESPEFATISVFSEMRATLAVHPTESATLPSAKGCIPLAILILLSSS